MHRRAPVQVDWMPVPGHESLASFVTKTDSRFKTLDGEVVALRKALETLSVPQDRERKETLAQVERCSRMVSRLEEALGETNFRLAQVTKRMESLEQNAAVAHARAGPTTAFAPAVWEDESLDRDEDAEPSRTQQRLKVLLARDDDDAFSDTLFVIIPFFSFSASAVRKQRLVECLQRLQQHASRVRVIVAEGVRAGDDTDLDLSSFAPLVFDHVVVSYPHFLWAKENLVNIAVKELPSDWRAFVWMDGDLEFTNSRWIDNTWEALRSCDLVQIGGSILHLDRNGDLLATMPTFARAIEARSRPSLQCQPGGAWGCSREGWQKLGERLVDWSIDGANDRILPYAIMGYAEAYSSLPGAVEYNEALAREEEALRGKVVLGTVPGIVVHHWHGDLTQRRTGERSSLLAQAGFDPARDLVYNTDGSLSFTPAGSLKLKAPMEKLFSTICSDADDDDEGVFAPQPRPPGRASVDVIVPLLPEDRAHIQEDAFRSFFQDMVSLPEVRLTIVQGVDAEPAPEIDPFVSQWVKDGLVAWVQAHIPGGWKSRSSLVSFALGNALPDDWRVVAWVHPGVRFTNPNWTLDAYDALQDAFDVVHLGTSVVPTEPLGASRRTHASAVFKLQALLLETQEADARAQTATALPGAWVDERSYGGGWAWSRTWWDRVSHPPRSPLPDELSFWGHDLFLWGSALVHHVSTAFFGPERAIVPCPSWPPAYLDAWRKKAAALGECRVGVIHGVILDSPHAPPTHRGASTIDKLFETVPYDVLTEEQATPWVVGIGSRREEFAHLETDAFRTQSSA